MCEFPRDTSWGWESYRIHLHSLYAAHSRCSTNIRTSVRSGKALPRPGSEGGPSIGQSLRVGTFDHLGELCVLLP